MRALVTGAGGFVGQWLCRALLRDGWDVVGISLEGEPRRGILSEAERRAVQWQAADLAEDAASVLVPAMQLAPTDAVFHLAGIAFQAAAASDADRAYAVNVGAAQGVLLSAALTRQAGMADPLVLIVGSAEQYGSHDAADMPLPETASCSPKTIYGITKLAQERMALAMVAEGRVRAIATRSFNHSGPGQAPEFFLPSLVSRALVARASGAAVSIGNTDVVRDFLHVEDVVTAYISLVSRGTPGEVYNVCSGHGVRTGDMAQEVLAAAGVRSPLQVDPALQRAVDVPVLVGDNSKLQRATGWTPKHSRSRIISDLLDAAS